MKQVAVSALGSHKPNSSSGIVQWVQVFIEDAAADWNLSPLTVVVVGLLPLLIAFGGLVMAVVGKSIFKWFAQEDGFAENLQVLFYLASFVMSIIVVRWQWRLGNRFIALLYCGLVLGLFFLTGEEISWGQRIFGWRTTGEMAVINQQNETNLHNLRGVEDVFKWVQLLVGAYGSLLPLLIFSWLKPGQLRTLAASLIPHPLLIPYFGLMFVWKFYRNLWPEPKQFTFFLMKYNEVMELALAMGFFFFLFYQLRRMSQSKETAAQQ